MINRYLVLLGLTLTPVIGFSYEVHFPENESHPAFSIPIQEVVKLVSTSAHSAIAADAWSFHSVRPQADGSVIYHEPQLYYDGNPRHIRAIENVGLFCSLLDHSSRGRIEYTQIVSKNFFNPGVEITYGEVNGEPELLDVVRKNGLGGPKILAIKCFAGSN